MQINAEWAGETVAWLDRHRETRPLLDKLRIDRRDLKYGRQISAVHFAALLDFGAAQTHDACFGLHRGGEFRLKKNGGVLAYLAACAETLGEALSYYQRYASIVCNGFTIEVERDDEGIRLVRYVAVRMGAVPAPQRVYGGADRERATGRDRRAVPSAFGSVCACQRWGSRRMSALVRLQSRIRRARRCNPAVDGHAGLAYPDGG
jgi:hypothetical protein